MSAQAVRTEACWPTPRQELLLRACFLDAPEANRAFEEWRASADLENIDDVSTRLLPLLARRWGSDPPDAEAAELGARIRLAHWMQNRQRIELAAELNGILAEGGIEGMFLKGIALIPHYGDSGLRAMGDIDFLVRVPDAVGAFEALRRAEWIPEDGLPSGDLPDQMRVRHAWQFNRGPEEICDLHWHPVVRCYSPRVAEKFWSHRRRARIGEHSLQIAGASEQFFHACAHGLQWSWTPQTRWVPDAMTILNGGGAESGNGESRAAAEDRGAVDWNAVTELAMDAQMTIRLLDAMEYLSARLEAPVPRGAIEALRNHKAPNWERREHELLQKPAPLGAADRVRWHLANFRRLRPFDREWGRKPFGLGLAGYLRAFLQLGNAGSLGGSLWRELQRRGTPGARR